MRAQRTRTRAGGEEILSYNAYDERARGTDEKAPVAENRRDDRENEHGRYIYTCLRVIRRMRR